MTASTNCRRSGPSCRTLTRRYVHIGDVLQARVETLLSGYVFQTTSVVTSTSGCRPTNTRVTDSPRNWSWTCTRAVYPLT